MYNLVFVRVFFCTPRFIPFLYIFDGEQHKNWTMIIISANLSALFPCLNSNFSQILQTIYMYLFFKGICLSNKRIKLVLLLKSFACFCLILLFSCFYTFPLPFHLLNTSYTLLYIIFFEDETKYYFFKGAIIHTAIVAKRPCKGRWRGDKCWSRLMVWKWKENSGVRDETTAAAAPRRDETAEWKPCLICKWWHWDGEAYRS